jgi:predicted neuraminidase
LFFTAQETRGGARSDWEARRSRGEVRGGFCAQWTAEVRRRVSTDNGHTWGSVGTAFAEPGSFCRQPILVMSNGEWLFPLYYSLLDEEEAHGSDYSVMKISSDEGRTWREYPVPGSRGRVHATVVELAPGRLIAFLRSRAADRIYLSRSDDYGRTWTEPAPTVLPNNNASIRAVRLQSGALALAFNQFSAQNEDPHRTIWPRRRWPLSLALSEDSGATWPAMRHLDTGDDFCGERNEQFNRRLSYPCLIQTRDGALHAAYSYRDRQCIKYVRITEGWIRDQRHDLAMAVGWRAAV